ncbi:hypothetical protein QEN19_002077 [Hanseniaspora menglaensis]
MSQYHQEQYYNKTNRYNNQIYQNQISQHNLSQNSLQSSSDHRKSSELPYPLNEDEYEAAEHQRRERQELKTFESPIKPVNSSSPSQRKNVTSPPQLVSKHSQNSVFSNTSTIYSKEQAYFQYFGHNYNEVIKDTTKNAYFTPYIQLKWSITLFVFSFHLPFIQHYNINCVELHRPLNDKELLHNSRIILEHAMKVLSRLCSSIKTNKREFDIGYPMALYFMGQLYSQKLDFDFLLSFFENDPIGAQQCGIYKVDYNELLKNLQSNLSKNKILPLNDFNAFKYYEKCYKALYSGEDDSSSDWILCGVSNLFRLSVCLEYGKGCDVNTYRSLQLFYEGWKDWKDPVSGYKLACAIIREDENYEFLDEMNILLNQNSILNVCLKILKELNSPQSNFELGKYYEKLYNEERFNQYDRSTVIALTLKSYVRSFDLNYNLASWKLGQIYEFGLCGQPVDMIKSLNFYYKDTTFPLNCLCIAGWLLTGNKEIGFMPDDKESLKWLTQALNCNNGEKYNKIYYGLGIYYQFGIGCQIDLLKSKEYMQKAAQLGHSKAQILINQSKK